MFSFVVTYFLCFGLLCQLFQAISSPLSKREFRNAPGYEVKEEDTATKSINRQSILTELASSAITAAEAAQKLAGN